MNQGENNEDVKENKEKQEKQIFKLPIEYSIKCKQLNH